MVLLKSEGLNVAVVGVTGAVGTRMVQMLEGSPLPVKSLLPLASARSAGKSITFGEKSWTIEEAKPESFEHIDIALFSAGGSVSKQLAPEAAKRGAIVVDNTSAFRMDPQVPLVVPEVNEKALAQHHGIIANPNCSTIQMVAALEPIRQAYGLNRIIVSTYQAVSGAGAKAIAELEEQSRQVLDGKKPEAAIMPVKGDKKHFQMAFNAIPQIDLFQPNDYTFEEMKMINETKKIMDDQEIKVSATCVRVPVSISHGESVYIEIDQTDVSASDLKKLLADAPGVILQDDPAHQIYPMPASASGKKEVFVGRIRRDPDVSNGFHLWIVSDNLLKGAAWNSVQIAERLLKLGLVKF
ncbi:aspartate-semialdehyde dehydrogenase [Sporolactobacillus terrae]|uniref:Aspartate-semialdehyde dehydrogenase n=1 Tax=Sporolactobacillus terrae TaxID=269673 RepID=A0A410D8E9_9BACL|nr:aspartate-semialdehyde dehydrogenase [Sporolactobacillus terrae]QAA22391.1 aspartate-semialdehyde dehydrogenase [Sporolactobacillus terrae]QAA25367.1 aspartate-semialdehyde dehydrogenase [Sporolactobacillus terrae]BBN98708.1 aspartate-semialdehyde dehydrogenase [Sporolactobacillus terrae]